MQTTNIAKGTRDIATKGKLLTLLKAPVTLLLKENHVRSQHFGDKTKFERTFAVAIEVKIKFLLRFHGSLSNVIMEGTLEPS